jgi:ATP-dependent Clp protease ATP-binding subunit ClpC
MQNLGLYIFIALLGFGGGLLIRDLWSLISSRFLKTPNQGKASDIARLYDIATALSDYFQKTANPGDLVDSDDFQKGVALLEKSSIATEKVIEYGEGDNAPIACMAYRALLKRDLDDSHIEKIIAGLEDVNAWSYFFALDTIDKSEKPVLGATLLRAQEWWEDNKFIIQATNDFVKKRTAKGDPVTFDGKLDDLSEYELENVHTFLKALNKEAIAPLLDEIKIRNKASLDLVFLNKVGHVWNVTSYKEKIIEHDDLKQQIDDIRESLFNAPERSVLIVGESGAGKSALLQVLFKQLEKEQWHVFQAGAVDVIAGQIYIGELEGRVQHLVKSLDVQKQVLWYIPDFHQMIYTGRHSKSNTGILDMILPYIESGKIKVIGELHPAANEQLGRDNKRVHSIMSVHQIPLLDDKKSLSLAKKWIKTQVNKDGEALQLSNIVFDEAMHLAKHFLNSMAAPGNLFHLLKMAQRRLVMQGRAYGKMKADDLYIALSNMTGLPRNILDDQEGLDPDDLRELFHKRVMGQPEAIDCLVERVAMIKAGLTDPTRPFGVFLFAGPTGTGKTEIAKTLAEFLFGSPERMIRLDMSEFQNPGSADRIIGVSGDTKTKSLAIQVREQPFSVLLLDEVEKAHDTVWDLFLQVFDDGRLTDSSGSMSDFRHTIIIMTSNLGATVQTGTTIGFENSSDVFSLTSVKKSISRTFRREFLNRIDRVVIFNPLDRSTMRKILYNELNYTLQRRGLRTKEWAVEWEESAINFLLEMGFTPDLGARPLKRAIERYLLAPLSLTIVRHQFPEGDQFLFVKSDGKHIQVEFIDPDAGDVEGDLEDVTVDADDLADLSLKTILLEPQRTNRELVFLETFYKQLKEHIKSPEWEDFKTDLISDMSSKHFWDSPERFKTLGDVEYMDRIESGLNTAESLINRIDGNSLPRNLIARLAQQLYLISEAHNSFINEAPQDAFLKIETKPKSTEDKDAVNAFALDLKNMYIKWAEKRLMKYEILDEGFAGSLQDYSCIMAFSGFAAYSILELEAGLHVIESLDKDKKLTRFHVRVQVAPQPSTPENNAKAMLVHAQSLFKQGADRSRRIIRRYQTAPTPLVRDNIRKWRTGRLDRVLDGNFDVIG